MLLLINAIPYRGDVTVVLSFGDILILLTQTRILSSDVGFLVRSPSFDVKLAFPPFYLLLLAQNSALRRFLSSARSSLLPRVENLSGSNGLIAATKCSWRDKRCVDLFAALCCRRGSNVGRRVLITGRPVDISSTPGGGEVWTLATDRTKREQLHGWRDT